MIKQITFLLFFTLLFSACVERGYKLKSIKPVSVAQPIEKKSIVKSPETDTVIIKPEAKKEPKNITIIKEPTLIKENTIVEKPVVQQMESKKMVVKEETSFFTLSDEAKENISGIFIIIIGIIILL